MRAAIGKAHLLMTKKFRQFRQLCNENLVSFETYKYITHVRYISAILLGYILSNKHAINGARN